MNANLFYRLSVALIVVALLGGPTLARASGANDNGRFFNDADVILNSVKVSPDPVPGGTTATGTVSLRFPVFEDVVVLLDNRNAAASVPDRVTIRALDRSATFPVRAKSVTALTSGALGASVDRGEATTHQATKFTVRPAGVQGVTFEPSRVQGGGFATGIVTLEAPSATGVTVDLKAASPAVLPKETVTIAPGTAFATFTVETKAVSGETPVAITATVNGVTKTGILTVTP